MSPHLAPLTIPKYAVKDSAATGIKLACSNITATGGVAANDPLVRSINESGFHPKGVENVEVYDVGFGDGWSVGNERLGAVCCLHV